MTVELERACLVGRRVRYSQRKHLVPLSMSDGGIGVHENPRSGTGTAHIVQQRKGEEGPEWTVFILPDEELTKRDRTLVILRLPPDEMEFI